MTEVRIAAPSSGEQRAYKGWSPVRIGKGAATQLQLDSYGEALDSIHLADTHALPIGYDAWTHVAGMVDWLCEHWDQP